MPQVERVNAIRWKEGAVLRGGDRSDGIEMYATAIQAGMSGLAC